MGGAFFLPSKTDRSSWGGGGGGDDVKTTVETATSVRGFGFYKQTIEEVVDISLLRLF